MSAWLSKSEWKTMDEVVILMSKRWLRRWASFYIDQLPRYRDVQTELKKAEGLK